MTKKLVLGLDGSDGSAAATRWCVEMATSLHAQVVTVHGVAIDAYPSYGMMMTTLFDDTWRKELLKLMEEEWCKPLADAGIHFSAEVIEQDPAQAIIAVADRENADMIVVGRRGRGGFAELVLGSVSHRLAHHAHQPLVIIPKHTT
ncbi:MAG TPA: universal stress protein [Actinomycetota bacterium]|nr:universal stress protein [Actinomycetota bacterium]